MKLTVLGCSGSYPGPDSPASGYLVEHDGHRIVLDLGNGAFGALQRFADPDGIEAVVLSHLHADHCLDLCGYWVQRKYRYGQPLPALPVYGPAGTGDRLARAYGMPADPGMNAEFDFRSVADGPIEIGPFRITTAAMVHSITAYAIRVEAAGRALVYSGDTAENDELVRLAAGCDLALLEASYLDGQPYPPGIHLSARSSGRTAAAAGAGRLVITHLVPGYRREDLAAQAATAYDGDLALAAAGAQYEV
ncbi:MAG: MBL fold metallo-hydrolase [Actinomycetota bacterium]|nr:MAG: MBL fold metallo-hydrolase [Actinomycetota bacterium]